MTARLLLEDGTMLVGESIGAEGEAYGEIVFNTGMTGYQEVLTDPSYYGQIVTMTYPLIGNYGMTVDDAESIRPHVRGFVVREAAVHPSNWRNQGTLSDYLQQYGIVAVAGVDTRMLTRIIREHGTMKAVITTKNTPEEELRRRLREDLPRDQVSRVTTPGVYRCPGEGPRIVAVDYGMKSGVVRSLLERGCDVVVVPAHATAEDILAWKPHGVMLSNGPGDPADLPHCIQTVADLLGRVPIFGICLGHQLLCLACGAKTHKLKFGHRGANHPVKDLETNRVTMTSQNHGYVVDRESLRGTPLELTHINQNDQSVEGVRHKTLPAFSVQYHPEARPGPDDSDYLFDRFLEMVETFWKGGVRHAETR
jgi:carbamoyl-phosphate synthase small subunit